MNNLKIFINHLLTHLSLDLLGPSNLCKYIFYKLRFTLISFYLDFEALWAYTVLLSLAEGYS